MSPTRGATVFQTAPARTSGTFSAGNKLNGEPSSVACPWNACAPIFTAATESCWWSHLKPTMAVTRFREYVSCRNIECWSKKAGVMKSRITRAVKGVLKIGSELALLNTDCA